MEPTRSPGLAPYLLVPDARGLVRFLEQGLGGTLSFEVSDADGALSHGEVRISDGLVMLAERPSGRPSFPAMVHLYVADAQLAYDRALHAGATSLRPPTEQPEGDRRGGVRDAWGNEWWFTQAPRRP